MMFASASLTHSPTSATVFSAKPTEAASASTCLRTAARLAGSDVTFNCKAEGIMGRVFTFRIAARMMHTSTQEPIELLPVLFFEPFAPLHDRFPPRGGVCVIQIAE